MSERLLIHPDQQFKNLSFKASEVKHRYGKNVHILSDPYLLTQLARLCSPQTVQPLANELITQIYTSLLRTALNAEFPLENIELPSRMAAKHAAAAYRGQVIRQETGAIVVNLARAGTLPSHICYEHLNSLLAPSGVRQDHISIARRTDSENRVTDSYISGDKIGGRVDNSYLLFPDPMGATGNTLIQALKHYQSHGVPKKIIALHCIVTPEYLKRVQSQNPEVVVYTVRLDRGLSSPEVLDTVPGERWDEEKGLDETSYIVPGGGGFGEILNNSYV
jgi:uracil phosphoribosyltransferase